MAVHVEAMLSLEWSDALEVPNSSELASAPAEVRRSWVNQADEKQVLAAYRAVNAVGDAPAPWWLRALDRGKLASRAEGHAGSQLHYREGTPGSTQHVRIELQPDGGAIDGLVACACAPSCANRAGSAVDDVSACVQVADSSQVGREVQRVGDDPVRARDGGMVVGPAGFEPATYWSQTNRATKLRYGPTRRRVAARARGGKGRTARDAALTSRAW